MSEQYAAIDQWILDHAYDPDDVVFGDRGLTHTQLPSLYELLDAIRPGWRDLFDDTTQAERADTW